MENEQAPNVSETNASRYSLNQAERAAIAEARRQETAIKTQMYDLAEQLKTVSATRNGMLMTIAFQQGLAGNWNLTPDGTALVKE